ncbi:uncharacterized protein VTP21DRAFT_7403 [Calcarisporiella thermophila]|uniref:uncharacterized protein n=1 Tax=Calcarisporiella thermophila TaxID=911321 RepID=UPI0037431550
MRDGRQDCYYFMNRICSKGDTCQFRHSEPAKNSLIVCQEWQTTGDCSKEECTERHSFYNAPSEQPDRSQTQCYWELNGGCKKPNCPFKHTLKAPADIELQPNPITAIVENPTPAPVAEPVQPETQQLPQSLPQPTIAVEPISRMGSSPELETGPSPQAATNVPAAKARSVSPPAASAPTTISNGFSPQISSTATQNPNNNSANAASPSPASAPGPGGNVVNTPNKSFGIKSFEEIMAEKRAKKLAAQQQQKTEPSTAVKVSSPPIPEAVSTSSPRIPPSNVAPVSNIPAVESSNSAPAPSQPTSQSIQSAPPPAAGTHRIVSEPVAAVTNPENTASSTSVGTELHVKLDNKDTNAIPADISSKTITLTSSFTPSITPPPQQKPVPVIGKLSENEAQKAQEPISSAATTSVVSTGATAKPINLPPQITAANPSSDTGSGKSATKIATDDKSTSLATSTPQKMPLFGSHFMRSAAAVLQQRLQKPTPSQPTANEQETAKLAESEQTNNLISDTKESVTPSSNTLNNNQFANPARRMFQRVFGQRTNPEQDQSGDQNKTQNMVSGTTIASTLTPTSTETPSAALPQPMESSSVETKETPAFIQESKQAEEKSVEPTHAEPKSVVNTPISASIQDIKSPTKRTFESAGSPPTIDAQVQPNKRTKPNEKNETAAESEDTAMTDSIGTLDNTPSSAFAPASTIPSSFGGGFGAGLFSSDSAVRSNSFTTPPSKPFGAPTAPFGMAAATSPTSPFGSSAGLFSGKGAFGALAQPQQPQPQAKIPQVKAAFSFGSFGKATSGSESKQPVVTSLTNLESDKSQASETTGATKPVVPTFGQVFALPAADNGQPAKETPSKPAESAMINTSGPPASVSTPAEAALTAAQAESEAPPLKPPSALSEPVTTTTAHTTGDLVPSNPEAEASKPLQSALAPIADVKKETTPPIATPTPELGTSTTIPSPPPAISPPPVRSPPAPIVTPAPLFSSSAAATALPAIAPVEKLPLPDVGAALATGTTSSNAPPSVGLTRSAAPTGSSSPPNSVLASKPAPTPAPATNPPVRTRKPNQFVLRVRNRVIRFEIPGVSPEDLKGLDEALTGEDGDVEMGEANGGDKWWEDVTDDFEVIS